MINILKSNLKPIKQNLKVSSFRHPKLQLRFFLYFAGLVIIIIVIISIAIFYFQKQILLQQAREKAFGLTRTLAYTSLNALLLDDYLVLQLLIDSMIDSQDILAIAILDTTGRIIAASVPEKRGEVESDDLTQKALSSDTYLLQKIEDESGEELWDTAVPIYQLDKRIGTARMKYSVEDVYKGLLPTVMGIGFFAVLVSLVLSYRFSNSISEPIKKAVTLANEYGSGNLDANISLNREDEIGELVTSLNKLSRELKSLIDEKISNENLIVMGEFASYIIHDLKNPLSGIKLLADGMHRKIDGANPLRKYAAEILIAAQKLQDFIERTLDIARASDLNLQPIDFKNLIDDALGEIDTEPHSVIKNIETDLPEIYGDYQLLLMAVKNILVNAVESLYTEGQISIKIFSQDKKEVVIRMSDTGPGIPRDRLSSIFRPFFSLKKGGHGLGLAMVKKAIILHQGRVEVESVLGEGATFFIYLPKKSA